MHLFQVCRQLPSFVNLQNHGFHGFLPSCAHYDVTYGASLSARPKRQTIIESEMREGFRLFALEQGRSLHWTRLPPRSATTLRLIFLTSARLISDYLTRNLHELIPTLPYSVRTRPCTSCTSVSGSLPRIWWFAAQMTHFLVRPKPCANLRKWHLLRSRLRIYAKSFVHLACFLPSFRSNYGCDVSMFPRICFMY